MLIVLFSMLFEQAKHALLALGQGLASHVIVEVEVRSEVSSSSLTNLLPLLLLGLSLQPRPAGDHQRPDQDEEDGGQETGADDDQQHVPLQEAHRRGGSILGSQSSWVTSSATNRSIGSTTGCTITEKATTRAFSWLKAPTSLAYTIQALF